MIRMIRSRRIRAGNVTRMEEKTHTVFLGETWRRETTWKT
jgi:hypothetical protein